MSYQPLFEQSDWPIQKNHGIEYVCLGGGGGEGRKEQFHWGTQLTIQCKVQFHIVFH